jgi:hypothetical protein
MTTREPLDIALAQVREEYIRARRKHAPMHSGHEGWAVIKEELDELWELVRADSAHTERGYHEAMQVAAMGVAFMIEIAGEHDD